MYCECIHLSKLHYMLIFYLCIDIDECSEESSNECDVNAECTNTEGSTCKCRDGYVGNGEICSGKHGLHVLR